MDIVTGALDSVLSKLAEFLKDEYNLQAGVREKITSLSRDLESMHAALRKVAGVPPTEVDELVKLWARDVREMSYTVEDILDDFLVRGEAGLKRKDPDLTWYQHAANKLLEVFSLSQAMARRQISSMIDIINEKAKEVAMRRERYRVDSIVAKPAASSRTVDPRLNAMYTEASQIIGIDKSSADLISMLSSNGDDESNQKMKIVSVVGVGGLGKTTLAKAVYDKTDKSLFDYGVFVPVGQNPDLKKVIRAILIHLDKKEYTDLKYTVLDDYQLIDELRAVLATKRYE
jgi:disease resistance protein RPM1